MAYVTKDLNPIHLGFLENTQSIWLYANTAGDTEATIKGAGFVSDASNKGVKVGDLVIVFNVAGVAANAAILAIASISAGAASIGASVIIT